MDVAEVNKLMNNRRKWQNDEEICQSIGYEQNVEIIGNMQKQFGGGNMGPLFGSNEPKITKVLKKAQQYLQIHFTGNAQLIEAVHLQGIFAN